MTEELGASVFDQIAAMEGDLVRLKDGAVALIYIASAHQKADIGQCGERILEHANVAYSLWRELLMAIAPGRDKLHRR
jgi:hypothetical protein